MNRGTALCIVLLLLLAAAPAHALRDFVQYAIDHSRPLVYRAVDDGFPVLPRPWPKSFEAGQDLGLIVRLHFPGVRTVRGIAEEGSIRASFVKAIHGLAERHALVLARNRNASPRVSLTLFSRGPTVAPSPQRLERACAYGIDGLALRNDRGVTTVLAPIDYLSLRLDFNGLLTRYGPSSCTVLKTRTWVCDNEQQGFVELKRASLPLTALSKHRVVRALREAADYLVREQRGNGQFVYEYCPAQDVMIDDYNLVRHAGVTWALLRLYGIAGKESLLTSGRAALRYMIRHVKGNDECAYLLPQTRSVVGASALAILALLALPEDGLTPALRIVARRLGHGLRTLQHDDGSFYLSLADQRRGRLPKKPPRFYPGEALLALTRLWEIDGQHLWGPAALRAAKRQIADFGDDGVPCHWSVQGLVKVGTLTRNRTVLANAVAMAQALARGQRVRPATAEKGSWPVTAGAATACSAACRLEALGPAIAAARLLGEPTRGLEACMVRGACFIISQQLSADNAFLCRNPSRALGGVRRSLNDLRIRMDVNQHVIAALLNTLELLHDRPTLAKAARREEDISD